MNLQPNILTDFEARTEYIENFEPPRKSAPSSGFFHDELLAEYDLGFTYLVNEMDREAMKVFTRLINDEDEVANSMALKLAAMYNN